MDTFAGSGVARQASKQKQAKQPGPRVDYRRLSAQEQVNH